MVLGSSNIDLAQIYNTSHGVLIWTDAGLFSYESGRVSPIMGTKIESFISEIHDGPQGLLASTSRSLFLISYQSLNDAKIKLESASEIKRSRPIANQLDVLTRWTISHPCAAAAGQLELYVVATNAAGTNVTRVRAVGFDPRDDDVTSFEATVPVASEGEWTFHVISLANGGEARVGESSDRITFATVGGPTGVAEWLITRWPLILGSLPLLLVALNLSVFARARYSVAAWRFATDASWGQTALAPLMLVLRQSRTAQLWLLDLYVQERRKRLPTKPTPFLALPLFGPEDVVADGDNVLRRLTLTRYLWVQGSSGMGKTAIFLHLLQTHFGGSKSTSLTVFRRDGYILIPIEARRHTEAVFDEKGASAWVVGCVVSVLSEGGLSFEDRGLLRAMLNKGTLAVAIDGLNESARSQAIAAFAMEFPATRMFVTSQEPGESPFENWCLPDTISEYVDRLLTLYMGEQQGKTLGRRLRDTGLMQHLRSGYDVRLVIDLAKADPDGTKFPRERIGLYRSAVKAAWPKGDARLEELQAAAWKIISERSPNEDKRQLKPDIDAPKDLLQQLESARERSGRSIRLIRAAPPGYEFVHDQMNVYLAASWLAERPSVTIIKDLLEKTKAWQDGLAAQRSLWGFVAAMLDRPLLEDLWIFAGDDERRAVFGRALAERAEREGWSLTRPVGRFVNIPKLLSVD